MFPSLEVKSHSSNALARWPLPDTKEGVDLKLVAVGPSDRWDKRDIQWTQRLFTRLADKTSSWLANIPDRIAGYSLHFYCGTAGNSSLDYTDADYYEHLWRADQMEKVITEHWNVLGGFDFDRKIKLYIDEWGAWYKQLTEVHSTHLFGQTSTMRDAFIAALTLDTFNRHADKVAVGNIAQLVNNLQEIHGWEGTILQKLNKIIDTLG